MPITHPSGQTSARALKFRRRAGMARGVKKLTRRKAAFSVNQAWDLETSAAKQGMKLSGAIVLHADLWALPDKPLCCSIERALLEFGDRRLKFPAGSFSPSPGSAQDPPTLKAPQPSRSQQFQQLRFLHPVHRITASVSSPNVPPPSPFRFGLDTITDNSNPQLLNGLYQF